MQEVISNIIAQMKKGKNRTEKEKKKWGEEEEGKVKKKEKEINFGTVHIRVSSQRLVFTRMIHCKKGNRINLKNKMNLIIIKSCVWPGKCGVKKKCKNAKTLFFGLFTSTFSDIPCAD